MHTSIMLLAIASIATTVLANPMSLDTRTTPFRDVSITFDDQKAIPAIPELTPVQDSEGLSFESFDLVETGLDGQVLIGVTAQTGKNFAAHSILGVIENKGQARIETAGNTKQFSVKNLYVACAANSLSGAVGIPTTCSIAFTAFRGDKPVATRTVQFDPDLILVFSNMKFVDFKDTDLDKLKYDRFEITVVDALFGPSLTALLVDSVNARTFGT